MPTGDYVLGTNGDIIVTLVVVANLAYFGLGIECNKEGDANRDHADMVKQIDVQSYRYVPKKE